MMMMIGFFNFRKIFLVEGSFFSPKKELVLRIFLLCNLKLDLYFYGKNNSYDRPAEAHTLLLLHVRSIESKFGYTFFFLGSIKLIKTTAPETKPSGSDPISKPLSSFRPLCAHFKTQQKRT